MNRKNIIEVDSRLSPVESLYPNFLTPHFLYTNYINSHDNDLKVKIGENMKDKKYHFVYETTNLINQKIYVGVHSTDSLKDRYLGSGKIISRAIKKYGKENFKREILKFFDTEEEAYEYETKLVNKEFVLRDNTYNCNTGGREGFSDKTVVVDVQGNKLSVFIDDPKRREGSLVEHTKGFITVIFEDGTKGSVTIEEFDNNKNLKGVASGRVSVKNKEGITCSVLVDDPRYINGQLVHTRTGTVAIRDQNGEQYSVTQEEFYNNLDKYTALSSGRTSVKDKKGNTMSVLTNDSRLRSGELVGITKNKILHSKRGKYRFTNGKETKYFNPNLEDIPKEFWKGSKLNRYRLISPNAEVFLIEGKLNLIKFCKENTLSLIALEKDLSEVIEEIKSCYYTGYRKTTVGWKLEKTK